jgi:hypothetical protein
MPKELNRVKYQTVAFRVNPAEKNYLRFAASLDNCEDLSSWIRSVLAGYIESKHVGERQVA